MTWRRCSHLGPRRESPFTPALTPATLLGSAPVFREEDGDGDESGRQLVRGAGASCRALAGEGHHGVRGRNDDLRPNGGVGRGAGPRAARTRGGPGRRGRPPLV